MREESRDAERRAGRTLAFVAVADEELDGFGGGSGEAVAAALATGFHGGWLWFGLSIIRALTLFAFLRSSKSGSRWLCSRFLTVDLI